MPCVKHQTLLHKHNLRVIAITAISLLKENLAKTIRPQTLGKDLKYNTFLKDGKMGNNPATGELHTYFTGFGIT